MKYVLLAILVTVVAVTGKLFALVLMYASPDNLVHPLHGSIYMLGSSIFIASVYYNVAQEPLKIMRWVLLLIGVSATYDSLMFSYYLGFAVEEEGIHDVGAASIFLISTLLVGVSTLIMFKNTKERVTNA